VTFMFPVPCHERVVINLSRALWHKSQKVRRFFSLFFQKLSMGMKTVKGEFTTTYRSIVHYFYSFIFNCVNYAKDHFN